MRVKIHSTKRVKNSRKPRQVTCVQSLIEFSPCTYDCTKNFVSPLSPRGWTTTYLEPGDFHDPGFATKLFFFAFFVCIGSPPSLPRGDSQVSVFSHIAKNMSTKIGQNFLARLDFYAAHTYTHTCIKFYLKGSFY